MKKYKTKLCFISFIFFSLNHNSFHCQRNRASLGGAVINGIDFDDDISPAIKTQLA